MKFDVAVVVGLLASLCVLSSQVPQVYKSFKSKRTRDLSLGMIVLLLSGSILWLTYGVMREDFVILFANGTIMIMLLCLLALKLKYK